MIEKYMIIADDKFWERGNELQELADALGAPTWALKQFFEKRIKEPNFTQRTRNVFQDLAAEDRKIVRARIGLKASTVKRQRREWFNNRLEEALDQFPAAREERDFLEKHLSAHRAKWIAGALDVTIGDMRIMIKTSVRKAADSVHRRKGKLASKTPRTKGPLDGPAKRACRTAAPGDFQWTPQIDEVLRDCAAILRARHVARGHRRVNWSAIAQVFSHFRNPSMECKRRLEHLQEVHVGEVEYLAALQAEWMRVWKKHAGTPALPDDDPRDVVNFDLRAHVLFLRKNVDKDAV
ncbi:hypothetical protein K437DRAFT_151138 [Tilletiaria anomala UBC 951]|uniref:Transcription factor tau subunit sfc3/Tfc3 C-terminal domain-containing protein n=1 Tax=Tilletiaria anomala (strain ATCC 24038 / CBS 436.72 / UBC 951) TaxID=1037660 RepID=A0A066VP66_TILAU|nr:uncharacterized protein K437DRAFT_151138 [Tilletiaria anomala UBC 951]KDN43537.1 hypothetical protein K437DRAFT_151138 [Tilletiaria anomala UBC 951]